MRTESFGFLWEDLPACTGVSVHVYVRCPWVSVVVGNIFLESLCHWLNLTGRVGVSQVSRVERVGSKVEWAEFAMTERHVRTWPV